MRSGPGSTVFLGPSVVAAKSFDAFLCSYYVICPAIENPGYAVAPLSKQKYL